MPIRRQEEKYISAVVIALESQLNGFFVLFFFCFPQEAVMKLQTETIKLSPGVKFTVLFFVFFFHMTYGNADAFVRLGVDADHQRFTNSKETTRRVL